MQLYPREYGTKRRTGKFLYSTSTYLKPTTGYLSFDMFDSRRYDHQEQWSTIHFKQVDFSFGSPSFWCRSRSDVRYCVSDFVKRRFVFDSETNRPSGYYTGNDGHCLHRLAVSPGQEDVRTKKLEKLEKPGKKLKTRQTASLFTNRLVSYWRGNDGHCLHRLAVNVWCI